MYFTESQYNLLIKEDEAHVFLYNTYSGAYIKLEKEIYALIHEQAIDSDSPCLYFEDLKKQGIIKPKELNEFNKIVLNEHCAVYGSDQSSLTFVIVPTLACNLKCKYCFENGLTNKPNMTDEMVMKTVRYIVSRITKSTKKVHITWFGGEPLVAYNQIKLFYDLLKKENIRDVQISSGIITNGVLLDKEKVKYLMEHCYLTQAQITVDGTVDVYCRQKGATVNQYLSVLKNIRESLPFIKISIRLNCDATNFEELCKVAKIIYEDSEGNKNLSFYLAKLEDYASNGENIIDLLDFGVKNFEFQKYLGKIKGEKSKFDLPRYRKSFCGLFKLKNTVIDPEGYLYKCEHFVGRQDKIIGDVDQGYYYTDEMLHFVSNKTHEKCYGCKLFPICIGGCPAQKQDLGQGYSCLVSEEYIKNALAHLE